MKDIFDYDVYDRNGDKVGSVENIWASPSKEIGFIGIRTGLLGLGRNHLIPADEIAIDEQTRTIRVPYDEKLIKSSPSFESHDELEDEVESNVRSHFGLTGWHRNAATTEPGFTSTKEQQFTGRRTEDEYAEGETVEVPLAQERIHIEKRERDLGEVRLRKVVRTETVNQPVELRHEEVVVERVTSAEGTQPGQEAFVEKVISIPVSEEEAVVEKTVESAGVVRARKVVESEQENVSETVRKEDVEVERDYEHAHHRE